MTDKPLNISALNGAGILDGPEADNTQRAHMKKALTTVHSGIADKGKIVEMAVLENSQFSPAAMRGVVLKVSSNSPARALAPALQRIGGRISVYEIPPGRYSSAADAQKEFANKNLAANLHDLDPAAPGVPQIGEVGTETTPWMPKMGQNHANFVGVFSTAKVGNSLADRRARGGNRYYLVAHTSADDQTDQLRALACSQKNAKMTAKELAESPEYARVQSTADRNNLGLMARACEVLGIAAPLVSDADAAKIPQYHCAPNLVDKAALTSFTRYGALNIDKKTGDVVVYADAIPAHACEGSAIALPIDALSGVHLMQSQTKQAGVADLVKNNYANALPVGGARSAKPDELDADEKSALAQKLFWPGKESGLGSEQIAARIGRSIAPRIVDDTKAKIEHGVHELQHQRLEPVAVIVNV